MVHGCWMGCFFLFWCPIMHHLGAPPCSVLRVRSGTSPCTVPSYTWKMDMVVSGDGAYQCTIVIHIDAHFSTRRVGRSPRVFFGDADQICCVFQDYCCVGCLKSKTMQNDPNKLFGGKYHSSLMQWHGWQKQVSWFNSGLHRDWEHEIWYMI